MGNRPNDFYCFCAERYSDVDRKVIKKFAEKIIELLEETPDGIEMPGPFGVLYISRFDKRVVDYNKTKKAGKPIYHSNLHSELQVATANVNPLWRHNRVHKKGFYNSKYLSFRPYRALRKMITRGVKDGTMFDWRYIPKRVTYDDRSNSIQDKKSS